MEIVRKRHGGSYVCFSIGTLENGRIHDSEVISMKRMISYISILL